MGARTNLDAYEDLENKITKPTRATVIVVI
jgi:hypothetical protein